MQTLQQLLDQEAFLSNTGKSKSPERLIILQQIREQRGLESPVCYGEDDCSTEFLIRCPWRIDCGT